MRTRLGSRRKVVAALTALVVTGVGLPVVASAASNEPSGDGAAAAIALSQRGAAEGSAQMRALVAGKKPAELVDQRSEFSKTVKNPDGTLTQTISTAPMFVPVDSGWTPTDTTLALVDGRVQPKAVIGSPSFSGGGDTTLASASISATNVDWEWGGKALPKPTLSGSTATYANVRPGVDLTVTATPTGFEDSFVVHSEQAAGQSLPITVSSDTGTVQQLEDGAMRLVNAGQEVATSPPAVEWDAKKSASGGHPNEDTLDVDTIKTTGPSTDSVPAADATDAAPVVASGTAISIDNAPDPSFAQDPSTVYPIVVDPNNSMSVNHFAVYRDGHSTYYDQTVNAGVGYGTLDGTFTEINRSAWQFNLSNVYGANQLTAASFTDSIAIDASSGSATQVNILNTDPVTNIAYPGPNGVSLGSQSVGHTATSTAWDLTSYFQGLFSGGTFSQSTANLELREPSSPTNVEGDGTHYIAYSKYPTLSITYDHPPVTGAVSAIGSYGTGPIVVGPQPTFTSTASDTDTGDYVAAYYAACQHTNPSSCVSGWSPTVAAGSAQQWNPSSVPTVLADGVLYDVAATAYDVAFQSGTTTTMQVLVDATAPQQLTASSVEFAQDGYTADPSNVSMSGTFTFVTTSSDINRFTYNLDSTAPTTLTPVVNGSGRKASVTLSVSPGLHAMNYTAYDNVGNPSQGVYYFALGVGIRQPGMGARTQQKIIVQGHDDDTTVATTGYATYYWAYPGKTNQLIADHVAPTGGGDFTAVTWDITAALGDSAPDQALYLILCFHTSTGTQTACSEYRQFQYQRHAFGGAYATQQVGPGTLASLTGDYAVSATDVSQGTYRGSLSIGRSFDTLSPQPAAASQPDLLVSQTNDAQSFENTSASPAPFVASTNVAAFIQSYLPYVGSEVLALASTGGGGLGGGVADNYASLEGDTGALRLGMRAGHTYTMTGHVFVPSSAVLGLTSVSNRSLRVVLFYKDSGGYHEIDSNPPTAVGWNTVSATMTIPVGASEAFARLYLGTSNGGGWYDQWDGMSLREVGPLGVGWNASIAGPDSGEADQTLGYDSTVQALTTTDPSGATAFYYYTSTVSGVAYYTPDGWDAPGGTKFGLIPNDPSVTPHVNTLNAYDADGTVTTFIFGASGWIPVRVAEPSANGSASTQFHFNTTTSDPNFGRVDEIVAATPPGAYSTIGVPADSTHPACAPDGTLSHLPAGCRALGITYGSSISGGDYTGMIKQVTFVGGYTTSDDGAHGVATPVVVANYTYNASGQLVSVSDPRPSTALTTTYTYTSTAPTSRLASITPPGLQATNLTYDSTGRLATVWHYLPGNVTPATTTIAYGVPLHASSSSATDLPNLDGTYGSAPSAWNETDPPQASTTGSSYATAVFPPDYTPSSSPVSADWVHASITYLDTLGRQVNTAAFGAGAWQIGTTQYDTSGNAVFTLGAENRNQALAPISGTTDPVVASNPSSATRAMLLGAQTAYSADGAEVTDTYGPAHPYAYNDGSGGTADGRTHAHVDYDHGAPNGDFDPKNGNQPYRLATTTTTSPCVIGTSSSDGYGCSTSSPDTRAQDTRTASSAYDAVLGGTDGWTLRTPTQSRTSMDGNPAHDIVTSTKYDSLGRTLLTEMPLAGQTSSDTSAHTTRFSYYDTCTASGCASTEQGSSLPSTCQSHYAYAGLPCQSTPAGAPSGVDANHPALTTTSTTAYNLYNEPTAITEANGTVTRSTATTYDGAGRITDSAITTAGDSSAALPAQHTAYSASTGLPGCVTTSSSCTPPPTGTLCTAVTTSTATVFTSYDSLGRTICVTDASANSTGNTTATNYDLDDRPIQVVDNKSTTTYAYNGTDANGVPEDRSLPTSESTTLSGSLPTTFSAGYNGDGAITLEKYPPATSGGTPLAYYTGYDNAGQSSVVWTQLPGALGGTLETTTHSIFGQTTGDLQQTGYANYLATNSYDSAGRLSSVADGYSTTTIPTNTIIRNYAYDADSNRTSLSLGTSYHAQVSADSPVAYWRLGDSGTSATDASGHGHTGTYTTYSTGTPVGTGYTQQVSGTTPNDTNSAANFTGWANNTGGYVSAPAGGNAALANNGPFTDELWFTTPANISTDWPIVLGEGMDSAQPAGYAVAIHNGHAIYFSSTTSEDCGAIPTGHEGWHYLAITFDGTTLRCYLDGQPSASTAGTPNGSSGADPIAIGADSEPAASIYYDNGSVDDVAIYGSALPADKINQHYRLALGGYDAQAHTYDEADRLTDSGVAYDQLGRTTTLPASLTNPGTINTPNTNPVSFSYYANDLVRSQSQGVSTDTMCLDPLFRLSYTATTVSNCTSAVGALEHYGDTTAAGSESAAWVDDLTAGTWSRNVLGLGGMAGTRDSAGAVNWALHNIHGDLLTTIADSTSATYAGEAPNNEFGTARTDAAIALTAVGPNAYGWLGTKRRTNNDLAGLTEMGQRLYDPYLGRFLQIDPVPGGSCNSYDYTCQRPVDGLDLDGAMADPSPGCRTCDTPTTTITVKESFKPSCPAVSLTPCSPNKKTATRSCADTSATSVASACAADSAKRVSALPKAKKKKKSGSYGEILRWVIKGGVKVLQCVKGGTQGLAAGGAVGSEAGPEGTGVGAAGGFIIGCGNGLLQGVNGANQPAGI